MEESNEGGLWFMSQQVSQAVQAGIDPMICLRLAATSAEEHRPQETDDDSLIREAAKQLVAVTRYIWGDRMGLVEFTKRRELQKHIPQLVKAPLFEETQPTAVLAIADETCPHT